MPMANYCRKCGAETPTGESCPYCGSKLAQTGERLSFGAVITPVRDWFSWNALLRVCLMPLALVALAALAVELAVGGLAGANALISRGFFRVLFITLAVELAAIFAVLAAQGRESVHYVLHKNGVLALHYIVKPSPIMLYSRLITPAAVAALNSGEDALEGYTLVKRVNVAWTDVRRVGVWRENRTLMFYRPRFWLALAVSCPVDEFDAAEAYARKKLKRFKHVKLPVEPKKT